MGIALVGAGMVEDQAAAHAVLATTIPVSAMLYGRNDPHRETCHGEVEEKPEQEGSPSTATRRGSA